jgi:hypothetical protein
MTPPFIGDQSPMAYAESLGLSAVYTAFGRVTHFARYQHPQMDRLALCSVHPRWPWTWYGTGNQDEIDKAESMPLCTRCLENLTGLKESDTTSWVGDHE